MGMFKLLLLGPVLLFNGLLLALTVIALATAFVAGNFI